MTKILTALVLSAFVTSAAIAQIMPNGTVICNGVIVGKDPDAGVRLQLLRDCRLESE